MTVARNTKIKATDVAAHAGVSIATVSLVANGKASGRVSESTRLRVEVAIKELGYVVNPAARSLVTGRHGRIALVAHDLTNPFIASIAAGVGDAVGSDIQLILAASSAGSSPPDVAMISSFGIDGMLIDLEDAEYDLSTITFPLVVIDEPVPRPGISRVYFDLEGGAAELAAHLAELGHRSVVYIDSNRNRSTFLARRKFFTEHFRRIVPGGKVLRVKNEIDLAATRDTVTRLLDGWLEAGTTAIVTATDIQAYGVLAALAGRKIAVPQKVSVASFDNNVMSEVTSPSLTSVDLSARDLGREAASLLLDEVLHDGRPGRAVQLPTTLVVRKSTARARR